jgi:hypothetical protein
MADRDSDSDSDICTEQLKRSITDHHNSRRLGLCKAKSNDHGNERILVGRTRRLCRCSSSFLLGIFILWYRRLSILEQLQLDNSNGLASGSLLSEAHNEHLDPAGSCRLTSIVVAVVAVAVAVAVEVEVAVAVAVEVVAAREVLIIVSADKVSDRKEGISVERF